MRLRTFTAPDMPTAMRQVRDALGDDAIILSSQTIKGKGVSVTAAVEPDGGLRMTDDKKADSPSAIRHPSSEPLRFEVQETLRFHNLPELFIAKIIAADRNAWQDNVARSLEKLLAAYFRFTPSPVGRRGREAPDEGGATGENSPRGKHPHPSPLPKGEGVTMLIGPSGVGKTLAIARIATQLAMKGQSPTIITTDTHRAGGVEQLQAFTHILDLPLLIASSPGLLKDYVAAAPKNAPVLIDTAGCNAYDAAEMNELTAFVKAAQTEPVLALAAGGDSLEAIDLTEAFMELPIKQLLVTRVDTAWRFGGVLAAAAAHGLAFCHASRSASVTEPLISMNATLLAQLLLRYKLQKG